MIPDARVRVISDSRERLMNTRIPARTRDAGEFRFAKETGVGMNRIQIREPGRKLPDPAAEGLCALRN